LQASDIDKSEWDFEGRSVIVTGAARGQGAAHTRAFARAGADVVLADVAADVFTDVRYPMASSDDLEQAAEECRASGVQAIPVICDVRRAEDVQAMVDQAVTRFGKVDVLVNNAGIATVCSVAEMTEAVFDETIATHLRGTFLCSQQVAVHMRAARSGRIIAIGSTQTFSGLPRLAHYSAAKHGMYGFCKALAIELAPYDVTVNMICPTGVDTVMAKGILAGAEGEEWGEEITATVGSMNLLGGGAPLQPENVSEGVLWLASDAARFMTGHAMAFDGGVAAK